MATLDQYLAETGQQSLLDQLRSGGDYEGAKSKFASQGWFGISPAQKSQQDSINAANQLLADQKKLSEQSVSTLKEYQPKISGIYETQRNVLQSQIDPTKARYDSLINELKGKQQTSEESARLAVNREMAKRGITQSSGLSDMTMLNTLNPIRREYAGLTQQTGLAQEADIKAIQDAIALLPGQETTAQLGLADLISKALSGGAGQAISGAQLLFGNAQTQADLAQKQIDAIAKQNYDNALLAISQAKLPGELTSQNLANQLAQINLNKKISGSGNITSTNNYDQGFIDWQKKLSAGLKNPVGTNQIKETFGGLIPLYQG